MFKPVAGVQLYVVAPVAAIVVVEPVQIAPEPGVTVIVGVVLTLIVLVPLPLHPFASVPLMV